MWEYLLQGFQVLIVIGGFYIAAIADHDHMDKVVTLPLAGKKTKGWLYRGIAWFLGFLTLVVCAVNFKIIHNNREDEKMQQQNHKGEINKLQASIDSCNALQGKSFFMQQELRDKVDYTEQMQNDALSGIQDKIPRKAKVQMELPILDLTPGEKPNPSFKKVGSEYRFFNEVFSGNDLVASNVYSRIILVSWVANKFVFKAASQWNTNSRESIYNSSAGRKVLPFGVSLEELELDAERSFIITEINYTNKTGDWCPTYRRIYQVRKDETINIVNNQLADSITDFLLGNKISSNGGTIK